MGHLILTALLPAVVFSVAGLFSRRFTILMWALPALLLIGLLYSVVGALIFNIPIGADKQLYMVFAVSLVSFLLGHILSYFWKSETILGDNPELEKKVETTFKDNLILSIHVGLWAILMAGFWFEWKFAMIVGILLVIGNISTLFMPVLINAIIFLVVINFKDRSAFLLNVTIFLLCALIAQAWMITVGLQDVAH